MKNQIGFGRLLEIAGERKGLRILSDVLSAASSAFMPVPYASICYNIYML